MKVKFKVKSSAISYITYDVPSKKMDVSFTSNPTKNYDFFNVPPRVVRDFINADSIGRYYHANIRGKYTNE